MCLIAKFNVKRNSSLAARLIENLIEYNYKSRSLSCTTKFDFKSFNFSSKRPPDSGKRDAVEFGAPGALQFAY